MYTIHAYRCEYSSNYHIFGAIKNVTLTSDLETSVYLINIFIPAVINLLSHFTPAS